MSISVCRYSREESFTAINADIRLHHNLFESLDSYVKGDLLEGGNAYHCEKCNKKVSFIKFYLLFGVIRSYCCRKLDP